MEGEKLLREHKSISLGLCGPGVSGAVRGRKAGGWAGRSAGEELGLLSAPRVVCAGAAERPPHPREGGGGGARSEGGADQRSADHRRPIVGDRRSAGGLGESR